MKAGTRVRITASGVFHGWEGVVQAKQTYRGVWLLVPGHPWQEKWPDTWWHFNDNEVE